MQELTHATDQALSDRLVDCMRERGWNETYVEVRPTLQQDPRTAAEQALDVLADLQEVADENEATDPDPAKASRNGDAARAARNEDEAQCFEEVSESVPDPSSSASAWIQSVKEDFTDRVAADPRMISAIDQESRCLAKAGYSIGELEKREQEFFIEADEIKKSVQNGQMDLAAARSQLEELNVAQRTIWDATWPCTEARLTSEAAITAELELKWLNENGDRLATAIAALEDDVAALSDQLRDIRDGA